MQRFWKEKWQLPVLLMIATSLDASAGTRVASIREIADQQVLPLMQRHQIPGMSIAISIDGKDTILNYGLASLSTRQPVGPHTLFEIGSVSKTFAATLASLAQQQGKLSWSDSVSRHLPTLRGSHLDKVSLLHLATHTSGLPLYTPDSITSQEQLEAYLKAWSPTHPIGSYRLYSNNGTGLLGVVAAKSLQQSYESALQKHVLQPLGLRHTFITVPAEKMPFYAQGYTSSGKPIRLHAGMLYAEAYGVKTTASDLLTFIKANINAAHGQGTLERAIANTHRPYFRAGEFTQDLMWEHYPYPVSEARVLQDRNSVTQGMPAVAVAQDSIQDQSIMINKTGSTNGFSSYVVYLPKQRIGVVLLANKSFPLEERVSAGVRILNSLTTLPR
jgi:beta-lactamase class C